MLSSWYSAQCTKCVCVCLWFVGHDFNFMCASASFSITQAFRAFYVALMYVQYVPKCSLISCAWQLPRRSGDNHNGYNNNNKKHEKTVWQENKRTHNNVQFCNLNFIHFSVSWPDTRAVRCVFVCGLWTVELHIYAGPCVPFLRYRCVPHIYIIFVISISFVRLFDPNDLVDKKNASNILTIASSIMQEWQ